MPRGPGHQVKRFLSLCRALLSCYAQVNGTPEAPAQAAAVVRASGAPAVLVTVLLAAYEASGVVVLGPAPAPAQALVLAAQAAAAQVCCCAGSSGGSSSSSSSSSRVLRDKWLVRVGRGRYRVGERQHTGVSSLIMSAGGAEIQIYI